ncbi:MAG: arabinooligosaccharide transport system substrate-binding protein [Thermomicrobiales bacterium]|nr:arabinooligosaccharide transport system substrate-binding protein [Thermomicrobiales bacterium]
MTTTEEENVDRHDDQGHEEPPMGRPGISRRGFLGVAAGAAASLSLATRGASAGPSSRRAPAVIRSQEDAELEVWGFDEGRLNFAKNAAQVPVFKDKYPNVKVNFRQFPFAEMHDKLLAALVSGRGAPDIAEVEIGRFSGFLKGDRVPFVPLSQRRGAEADNIYKPAATDPWTWQGEIYGLGNELNAVVLSYRKDLLDGLGVETPFQTWDQVIEAGKKIAADGETKTFALHDIAFGDWFQMAQHAGTGLFDAEGNYVGDNPLSVQALQFLHDLVYVHQVAGIAPADAQNDWFGPAYWAAFKANKFAMLWGPPWHIGGLPTNVPDQSGKWAIQKLPTGLGESKATANFGGTGQCITEQSEHQDICWDLLAAGNLTVEGHLFDFKARTVYPAYIPAYQSPELQEPHPYFGGAKLGELYASVAPDLPPFHQSPYFFDATQEMIRSVITPVMNDKAEPQAGLTELRGKIEEMTKE